VSGQGAAAVIVVKEGGRFLVAAKSAGAGIVIKRLEQLRSIVKGD
jgi:hypothetical protein